MQYTINVASTDIYDLDGSKLHQSPRFADRKRSIGIQLGLV